MLKPGLIVSVSNSTKIDINNSEFNTVLSNKINDSTVFGVISSISILIIILLIH